MHVPVQHICMRTPIHTYTHPHTRICCSHSFIRHLSLSPAHTFRYTRTVDLNPPLTHTQAGRSGRSRGKQGIGGDSSCGEKVGGRGGCCCGITHAHTNTQMHSCTSTHTHTRAHARTHTHTRSHNTYTYTQTHTHTRTRTHTQTLSRLLSLARKQAAGAAAQKMEEMAAGAATKRQQETAAAAVTEATTKVSHTCTHTHTNTQARTHQLSLSHTHHTHGNRRRQQWPLLQ